MCLLDLARAREVHTEYIRCDGGSRAYSINALHEVPRSDQQWTGMSSYVNVPGTRYESKNVKLGGAKKR